MAEHLVLLLHGAALRELSMDQHFQGVGQAARLLRKQGKISNRLSKKLLLLDSSAALVRHITTASSDKLLHDLRAELHAPYVASDVSAAETAPDESNV